MLEAAIVQSHKILSKEQDPKAFVDDMRGDGSMLGGDATDGDLQQASLATRRAQDAELQQEIMTKALEFERSRHDTEPSWHSPQGGG